VGGNRPGAKVSHPRIATSESVPLVPFRVYAENAPFVVRRIYHSNILQEPEMIAKSKAIFGVGQ